MESVQLEDRPVNEQNKAESKKPDEESVEVPERPTSAPPVLDVESPSVPNPNIFSYPSEYSRIFLENPGVLPPTFDYSFPHNFVASASMDHHGRPFNSPTHPSSPLWNPQSMKLSKISLDDFSSLMDDPMLPDLSSDSECLDNEEDVEYMRGYQQNADPVYLRQIWEQPEQSSKHGMVDPNRPDLYGYVNPQYVAQPMMYEHMSENFGAMQLPQQMVGTGPTPLSPVHRSGSPAEYPYGMIPQSGMQIQGVPPMHQMSMPQMPFSAFGGYSVQQPVNSRGADGIPQYPSHQGQIPPHMGPYVPQYVGPIDTPQHMLGVHGGPMLQRVIPQMMGSPPLPPHSLNFSNEHMPMIGIDKDVESMNIGGGVPVCKYFASGNCIRGERCNFSHMKHDGEMGGRKKPGRGGNSNQRRPVRSQQNPIAPGPQMIPAPLPAGVPVKKIHTDVSRFSTIDQVVTQVYQMCKDQHGCRFLQKKLEEKNPRTVAIVFDEVYDHMVELMTDPFGNYLCQKLIEHCDEKQQLLIVQKVSSSLVTISKNMHGTRAVQKMIECLSTPAQVQLVVNALKAHVVELIQDLNGNHVIQRCLNRLSTQDKQFVYDAVAEHCVEVATHRHGCCVMQRCIDFASEEQKLQLVQEIARNVLTLVQDAFGNYVVQYVLELPFKAIFSDLISNFLGHLADLSTQKFSSNVIEKCLRVSSEEIKKQMVEEISTSQVLQVLLQDPYGNYVVQTALTIADAGQRAQLVEAIKPHLATLRNTPYGKRIQNKIQKDLAVKSDGQADTTFAAPQESSLDTEAEEAS